MLTYMQSVRLFLPWWSDRNRYRNTLYYRRYRRCFF